MSPHGIPERARPVPTLLKMKAPEPKPSSVIPLISPLFFGNHVHPACIGVEYEMPVPTPDMSE